MKRSFVLSVILLLVGMPIQADIQFHEAMVGIEQVEVAEVAGDTLIMVVADDVVSDAVIYPCADTDADRLLVALLPGLDPGSSWKMLHATLLAAMSRGADVRIRMGDCIEYKPGRMAREIIGVIMFG